MKKKCLFILLIGVLVLGLTGCGSNKATIVDNNGNTVSMSYQQLINEYKENSIAYEKKYELASIDLISYVESVKSHGTATGTTTVFLEDKWEVALEDKNPILSQLSKGTKVHVRGKIYTHNGTIAIIGGTYNYKSTNFLDYSNVKIEIVN